MARGSGQEMEQEFSLRLRENNICCQEGHQTPECRKARSLSDLAGALHSKRDEKGSAGLVAEFATNLTHLATE